MPLKLLHQPDLGVLLFRLYVGLAMAFAHGISKVPPSEQFVSGVEALGFPLPVLFAWSAGLTELVGGLLIALGLGTRFASFGLGFTMAVAAFGRHGADPFKLQELSLFYLFACVLLIFFGAGKFSLDRLIFKK
jgi:putative oxidoreductase